MGTRLDGVASVERQRFRIWISIGEKMATQTAIISADEVAKLVPAVVSQSEQITVSDSEDYEMACSFLTLIATRKKQVGETFDPIVAKAHSTWKEACAQREKFLSPLTTAEQTVKSKVTSWRM